MVYRIAKLLACSVMVLALSASGCLASHGPEVPPDPIMGEFAGTLTTPDGKAVKAEVKLIADEDSKYRVVLLFPAGNAKAQRIELNGRGKDGVVSVQDQGWSGKITKEAVSLESAKAGKAEMTRVDARAPRWVRSRRPMHLSCSPSRKARRPTSTTGPTSTGFASPTVRSW